MKLNMLVLLVALWSLCYGIRNIHCSTVPGNNTDMLSLLNFRQAITNDPGNVFSNWNKSIPFCQWKGVTCGPKHPERVTALNLAGQGLSGPISPSVGNLKFLHTLDLSANSLSGPMPPLNNLQRIQFLILANNSLDGTIPDTITNCSDLRKINLINNLLVGQIPLHVGLLSKMTDLILSRNKLTGIIPLTLRNNTQLKTIDLGSNQLEGVIPDELGQLSNLSFLSLGGNNLSGGFPTALLNLTSLQTLDLDTNMLRNTLPPNIGDALRNLQVLYLGVNMFEGRIPASLGNASSLEIVFLNDNLFTGQVPSLFGKLPKLSILTLENNKLEASDTRSWDFMHALTNCSNLNVLVLRGNRLRGVVPDSVGNLSVNLQQLLLGKNNISGVVPPSIGNIHGLVKLGLNNNNFTGTIEEWIGNLKNLQGIFLYGNSLTGQIPSSIGNLTQLSKVYLQDNKFVGTIPGSLGYLKQLDTLYLSSNELTGEIPDTLGQCQALVDVEMDQNFLIGNIPASFINLQNLIKLNVSHNNLSGTIPSALSELPGLEKLDLSYNHLSGEIPMKGVFSNASSISLGENWGLCGGPLYLRMPPCQVVSQRTKRSYYLVKVLIPVFGFLSLILLVYFLLVERKKSRKHTVLTSFGENFLKVSYSDLALATANFSDSNLVGRGSYGSVYRGKLKEQKMDVAVKVFDLEMQGAERSFLSECEALRSIQHRNLLPIITACSTVNNVGNVFKALVYEFMPNGSLDAWLHHKGERKTPKHLGLHQRISIAVNIADALDYLHHDCGRPTVHCDLKPSNILLDDDMTALLGDFGIARFYVNSSSTSTGSISTVGVKGTIGYIAPEYGSGGHVSTSGDVYSFGVVLVEIMTGRRPTDPIFKDGLDIMNFVQRSFPDQIIDVVDPHLIEEYKNFTQEKVARIQECLVSLLQLAICCTLPTPSDRMNMKQIATKLHAIQSSYLEIKLK